MDLSEQALSHVFPKLIFSFCRFNLVNFCCTLFYCRLAILWCLLIYLLL